MPVAGGVPRLLAVALLALSTGRMTAADMQAAGTLRIRVTLVDSDQRTVPVPRHALLVSDNPATTSPRRVVTGPDGTVTLRLPPGNYTVESDRPMAFQGREYQWVQTLDVLATGETPLELTAANADAGPVTDASAPPAGRRTDASDVLTLWQQSVLGLWTPTTTASAFLVDRRGLLATSQQVVGTATSVEVQLTPARKLEARVLVADRANDTAVLWIDAGVVATLAPIPLGCGPTAASGLTNGQEIVALDNEVGRRTRDTPGTLGRVTSRTMIADLELARGAAGGPAFSAAGTFVGMTSFIGAKEGDPRDEARIVRADAVCEVIASAEKALASAPPPSPALLPVEPPQVVAEATLVAQAKGRAGSLAPLRVSSLTFDVAFLTPLQVHAGQASMDFANWAIYVADRPSALLLRVTPKQSEAFWATAMRGLALTRGVALPPITRFVAGFGRLRARCGDAELTPIHPFLLERRVSETDAIHEGLYVFDPGAIGPHCAAVTLELWSDKAGAVAETVTVDAKILQQVWQDLAPIRALP